MQMPLFHRTVPVLIRAQASRAKGSPDYYSSGVEASRV